MAIKRESGALRFEGTRDLEDSRSQRPRESHFELIHSLDCNLASPNFRTAAQISLSITSDILHLDAAHESSLRGREREAQREGTGFEEATRWWFKWHFRLYFIISFIPFPSLLNPQTLITHQKKRKKIVRHSYKYLANKVTQVLFFFHIVSDFYSARAFLLCDNTACVHN